MAIDPGIILAARGVQMKDPFEAEQQAQSIIANRMALQRSRQERESVNALSRAFKGAVDETGKLDQNRLITLLAQEGQGAAIPGIQKSFADISKADALAKKAKLDLHYEQLRNSMSDIASINSPELAIQKLTQAMSDGTMDPAEGQSYIDALSADPSAFGALKQQFLQRGLSAKEQLDMQRNEIDQKIKALQLKGMENELSRQEYTYEKTDAGLVPVPKYGLPEGAKAGVPLKGTEQINKDSPEAVRAKVEAQETAKADVKAKREAPKKEAAIRSNLQNLDDTISLVDTVSSHKGLSKATGLSSAFPTIPGSKSADFEAKVETLKARLGFAELQRMRESSPTGGALGSITERELSFLQAAVQSLGLAQSEQQYKENLGLIKSSLERLRSAQQSALQQDEKQAFPGAPAVGSVVDGYEFLGGNPNDQKSWKKR